MNRAKAKPGATSPIAKVAVRLLAAGSLGGIFMLSASAPLPMQNNTADPESRSAMTVESLEGRLRALRTTDTQLYFLNRRDLPPEFWDEKADLFARGAIYRQALEKKYPAADFEAYFGNKFAAAEIAQTTAMEHNRDNQFSLDISGRTSAIRQCLIVNLDARMAEEDFRGNQPGLRYHKIFSEEEKRLFVGAHELSHCEYSEARLTALLAQAGLSPDDEDTKAASEAFADMRGAAIAIAAGHHDAAVKVADMRASYTDAARTAEYYSAPLLRALDMEIRALGCEDFSALSPARRDAFVRQVFLAGAEAMMESNRALFAFLRADDRKGFLAVLNERAQSGDVSASRHSSAIARYLDDVRQSEARLKKDEGEAGYDASAGRRAPPAFPITVL